MKQENYEIHGICSVCLNNFNLLYSLGAYEKVYFDLIRVVQPDIEATVLEYTRLCLECKTALRHVHEFVEKLAQAQQTNSPIQPSKLGIVHKSDVDYTFIFSEERKDEVHLEIKPDIKLETFSSPEHTYDDSDFDDKNFEHIKFSNVLTATDLPTELESAISEAGLPLSMEDTPRQKRKYNKKPKMFKYKKILIEDVHKKLLEGKHYSKIELSMDDVTDMRNKMEASTYFQNAKYKCKKCIVVFQSKTHYTEHRRQLHKSGALRCQLCSARLATATGMERHWRQHLTGYRCLQCNFTRQRRTDVFLHYRHNHGVRWLCLECDYLCDGKKAYSEHLNDYHKQFTCDMCASTFRNKATIIRHINRMHSEYECSECNRTFKKPSQYRAHFKREHAVAKIKDLAYCVECDKQFKNEVLYKRHLHASTRHNITRRLKDKERKYDRFPCPDCGKVFHRRVYLNQHKDLVHLNKCKNRCPHCHKFFARPSGLRLHVSTVHEGYRMPKVLPCELCGRMFQNKQILTKHIRTHTGERPYECHLCPAKFAQRTPLQTHLKNVHLHMNKNKKNSVIDTIKHIL